MNENVEKAFEMALKAHKGQVDKAGKAYIMHPVRVASKFKEDDLIIVSLLHDVVEDTDIQLNQIESMFGKEIALAVDGLTRRESESYDDFISRCSKNELSRRVKIEDLKDNMNLSRLKTVSEKDLSRVEKYKKALNNLMSLI
ncbi:MAG: HD domain-containing protein [Paludibacteraceae bacterium]|nr:HD domain-containing protein [Paludibacteraceae bacterium]